jgi:hypothetical protein
MSNLKPPAAVTRQPIYALVALVAFLASTVTVIVTGNADSPLFWPIVAGSVPSLVAAIAAERASRDIRNGTIVEKAREGAVQAIEETEVLTRNGPVVAKQLDTLAANTAALTTLLGDVHGIARANLAKLQTIGEDVVKRNDGDA